MQTGSSVVTVKQQKNSDHYSTASCMSSSRLLEEERAIGRDVDSCYSQSWRGNEVGGERGRKMMLTKNQKKPQKTDTPSNK